MFGFGKDDSATVVRLLAEQVRRDISFGVLAPDTKLKIEELRQRYGGSAHSLREALTLLASDGLVEANAQRGFRVASATQADLEDITRMRAEIECIGLRWSMKHGGVRWEGEVMAALHALSRAEDRLAEDAETFALEWDEANREFHAKLVAACRSPRLIAIQKRLFDQSRRFRLAALREGRIDLVGGRKEYEAIMSAILAHDVEGAVGHLSDHILGSLKI